MITVSGLFIYPLKSAGGIELTTADIGRMGFYHDRQWMVVDAETGMFVAQRSDRGIGIGVKSMCLITPEIKRYKLILRAPGMSELQLPLHGTHGEIRTVQIWDSFTEARDQGEKAAEWITKFLSRERPGSYRIVRMSETGTRRTKEDDPVAFQDSRQLHVISEASLADLNCRYQGATPMNRFRPNIVLKGCQAYEEDSMDTIRIGRVEFTGLKLCNRCSLLAIDQETGEYTKEPLRTLATYRQSEKGIVFGRHFSPNSIGRISVGDTCDVIQTN